jgi:hypothetical protein
MSPNSRIRGAWNVVKFSSSPAIRTLSIRALTLSVTSCVSLATGPLAGVIQVPSDSTTIQAAIRGAQDGDTVLVAPGTYVENVNFLGKAILVTSEAGAAGTIIDGSAPAYPDSGSVVYFVSGEDSNSIIRGFTITSGSGTYMEISPSYWVYCGGGILCVQDRGPLISDNILVGNVSECGAAICCCYSDATVVRNVIALNVADHVGGGLWCFFSNAWIEGNLIANCTTVGTGGGVSTSMGSPTIVGNTIVGNASGMGGGVCAWEDYYGLIEDNYIAHNTAWADGGGIYAMWSEPVIRHNVIEGNAASGYGGGMYCEGGLIQENSISYNLAWGGGGIWTQSGAPTIVGNTIRGNIADGPAGGPGGICVAGGTSETTVIANNLIVENSSLGYGGGIKAGRALISNNTISNNDAVLGGGLFCYVYPYPEFLVITNNIISSNSGGYGIYNDSTVYHGVPDLHYNDVWDNGINYYGCPPGPGDISVDPEFAEPEWGHYSLMPSSPCLDAGDPSIIDPDGTRSNMGAFGGPDAKLVHLTLVPEADTLAAGTTLIYEAILSNNFADPLTTFGLTELLMPGGFPSPLNPLVGPMRVSLRPYQTVHKTISHYVPPAAPEGGYWYTGKVGFPPDVLEDMDAFPFHVAE